MNELIKRPLQIEDYPLALEIWERSVIATHDFLKEKDRTELKKQIPTYFKHVNANLWLNNQTPIGFSGTNENNLEMLFIDPKHFRKGYGTIILKDLIRNEAVRHVDVNQDNPNAIQFYTKNGFTAYKTSSTDGQGRNYPIIHMKLNQ